MITAVRLLSQRAAANPECSHTFKLLVEEDRQTWIEIRVRDFPGTCAETVSQPSRIGVLGASSTVLMNFPVGLFQATISRWQKLADPESIEEFLSSDYDTGFDESEDEKSDFGDERDWFDVDDSETDAILQELHASTAVDPSHENSQGHAASTTESSALNTTIAESSHTDALDLDEEYEGDAEVEDK